VPRVRAVFVDVLGVGSEQTVACGGDHHGIDDHRHVEVVDVLRDDRDNGRSCEHPSLYRTDVKVGWDSVDLRVDLLDGGRTCDDTTPSVFCAVTAVMALVPNAPPASIVLRSA